MNLRGIDLNLLVILDALLEERHVSRAAARLNLSQPATSNALARCRSLIGDPLLVRAPAGLRRTPKAEELRAPLREALARMGAILEKTGPPDLKTIRQPVRMVMADFPAATIAAPLLRRIADHAPGIDLIFHPWHFGDEIERLNKGEIDLSITIMSALSDELRSEQLGRFGYQVVMRRGHPVERSLTLKRWLQYPHVIVSGAGETKGPVDLALAAQGLTRRVGAVVPTFLLALQLVEESDLITTLPMSMQPSDVRRRFAIVAPPLALGSFPLMLVRHIRSDGDAAVRFVTEQILELLKAAQINPASGDEGSA